MQKSVPYKLSIRIEADGFSFVLTQNGKLLLKRQLWCNKNELVNKLVAELQLQNLSDKLFDQVEVIIHSPKAQLIPQEIYRQEDETHWLQLKHKDKQYISSDTIDIYECYNIYERALEKFERLYAYGMLFYNLDMSNQEGIKLYKEVEALGTTFSTQTSFITPEITYEPKEKIEGFLKENAKLQRYKRDICDILEEKDHILSKEEENLLANYSEIFSAPENTFDILTNAEFKFGKLIDEDGKEVELTDATYTKYLKSSNIEVRKQAFYLMYRKYSEYINTLTEMYLSNVKQTVITSKLRKYTSSLEKATIHDDATIKVYDALMQGVNEGLEINHDFISLKRKLLNMKEMHIYDIYVNPFQEEKDKISFEDAKKEVKDALSVLGKEYGDILDKAFENRWIDVYEKPNKRGGAYSSGVYGVHPFVLMSFNNSKRDVSTIAHELGHSIHSYYSNKNQNIINSDYTILVAEVASTVNEILLSVYQIENESNKLKKAELIYELLEMIRATFYRQSMFAEFEKIIHEKIEKGEMLSAENLNNIYYDLNVKYFGNDITIDKEIQYEWARIPHFYYNYYVYQYATGFAAASYLADKVVHGTQVDIDRYLDYLKAGNSDYPLNVIEKAGVDMTSSDYLDAAFKIFEDRLNELEALVEKGAHL